MYNNNYNSVNTLNESDKQRLKRKRERAKFLIRFSKGMTNIGNILLNILLAITAFITWKSIRLIPADVFIFPILSDLIYILLYTIVVIFFLLIAILLTVFMGTHREARKYEDMLLSIRGFISEQDNVFLISKKWIPSEFSYEMIFYSTIPLKVWVDFKEHILHSFGMKLIGKEPIRAEKHKIILNVREANSRRIKEVLYDDET